MIDPSLMAAILDSLKDPILFADTEHVTRYMNKAAVAHYKEGENLIGRSLLDCHNERSQQMMIEILADMHQGLDERLITDNDEELYINVPGKKFNPADYADQYVLISGLIHESEGYMTIAARSISVIDSMDEYGTFDEGVDWYCDDYEDDDFDDFIRSSGRSGGMGFSGDY